MDLGGWLRSLGLERYEAAFRENEIDETVLPSLTHETLKELGVAAVGHRLKLLDAIAALRGDANAKEPPSEALPHTPASTQASAPSRTAALPAEAVGERRYLTVMFCDLVGSTGISARLDAEEWRDLVGAYLDAASAAVTEMGGHVAKKLGDGLMALFGYPVAEENDAERAVRAALAIQRALAELNRKNAVAGKPELVARIGLETGPVVVDTAGEIYGDAPNVAARVQALAEPGAVLVTARVQRQVAGLFVAEDRGAHTLKGVPEPTALFRLVRASGGGRRSGQRNLTPLVGRDDEMAMLLRRWERARQGDGQLVMIVGEPGLGKSRLIEEFHARLSDTPHTWVEWSCSQLLRNTPLHPIAEWGRQRFGGADVPAEQRLADLESSLAQVKLDPAENAPLLAPLLDIPLPKERTPNFAPEELRRRQLAALTNWVMAGAKVQPVVLAFEDLHWADPTTLDVLRGIAERGALAPLFIVATTRPEFRPPWSMRSHHGTISLAPLDRLQVREMVAELSARHALPREVVEDVAARTGGVPLFVEEVTRLLLERGEQGGIQTIPPTLQQSLMARLDRLGPAREVAQVGSVIGRGFSYGLLRDVAGIEDAALQAALERLAEADIVLVQGTPPESDYRFKHALIQDAAYENLLKSRRQVLHRRVAEILRDRFAATAAAEPEALAHHFTQAGMTEAAIEWWGKAGDQALRRSAFQEAIAHLGKAIEMADNRAGAAPQTATPGGARVKLQTSFGAALIAARGDGSPETTAAFARARELAAVVDDPVERLSASYGLWVGILSRGEAGPLRAIAEVVLRDIEGKPPSLEAAVAHRIAGVTEWYLGNFELARAHLGQTLAMFDPQRDRDLIYRFGRDVGVSAMVFMALTLWPLGETDEARRIGEEMLAWAVASGHILTTVYGHFQYALLHVVRRDAAATAPLAEMVVKLAHEHDMPLYSAYGEFIRPWARWHLGEREGGLAAMRGGIAACDGMGNVLYTTLFETALAEAEAEAGEIEAGIASIDHAVALTERTGQRWNEADTHRVRGEILVKCDPANTAPAEEAFLTAIAIAQQQKARSFELRAALSLARLYQSTNRAADAHAVLAPAVEGFSPTPEFPEIEEARALLATLSATDEVKNAASARQRRVQLQLSLGNALIAARGHGASETTAAFARASELAEGITDPSERLSIFYGLWVGSFIRCEIPLAREVAAAALPLAERYPGTGEAAVAYRLHGLIYWFEGDFANARKFLERALVLFDPERDRDLAFRFGQDIGVAFMNYLALALWPLGETERAQELEEASVSRARQTGHVATLAYAATYRAVFEMMRLDADSAAPFAAETVELAKAHGLQMYMAYGAAVNGWVRAVHLGETAAGMAEMRQGIEALRQIGINLLTPLFHALLASLEAKSGEYEGALGRLDRALAETARNENRTFDAELHRIRGDILLKRDRANTAPAEEAFLTAIAISQKQKARSFELRAALSLAKLYQSTGRTADAHATLAPALEGFALTPAFPEIAEAQTFLAVLAQSDEMKTEVARRQLRFRLQSAYSNALLHGRGMSPPETTAAFARARELATTIEDPSERFSTYYGLWVGPFIRGNLTQMREVAEAFMRDAERQPDSPEAGIAHRLLGTTCWYVGDYAGAQSQLDRALALYDHKRDLPLSSSFAYDQGVLAKFYLGMTYYALGRIDRGGDLIEESLRLALQGGHIPTVALTRHYMVVFAAVRRDLDSAAPHARALLDLGVIHDLPSWHGFAKFTLAWVGRRDNPKALTEMRAALAMQRDMDFRVEQPLFGTMLAEAEAAAGELDAALSSVNMQLAVMEQTGERWFEAEVHRARGDILLKRDPANTAPAEEAFLAAIAIAKEQKARSFELRATMSLARLWRDQGKPQQARELLAPVYGWFTEGFDTLDLKEAKALLEDLAT